MASPPLRMNSVPFFSRSSASNASSPSAAILVADRPGNAGPSHDTATTRRSGAARRRLPTSAAMMAPKEKPRKTQGGPPARASSRAAATSSKSGAGSFLSFSFMRAPRPVICTS